MTLHIFVFLSMVGAVIIGDAATAAPPVIDGLTGCVRADNGRPVCKLVATDRHTFVSEEFFRRYQSGAEGSAGAGQTAQATAVPVGTSPHGIPDWNAVPHGIPDLKAVVAASLNRSIGPTYDCTRARSSLSQMVCLDPQLRLVDVRFSQAYYALRHSNPSLAESYRNEVVTYAEEVVRRCDIPNLTSIDQQFVNRHRMCVEQMYVQKIQEWHSNIARAGNASVGEEVRRNAADHYALQYRLRELSLIAANAPIDGVYGPATRDAIAALQRAAGLPPTGFMSNDTRDVLLRMPIQSAAALLSQTPAPAPRAAAGLPSSPTPVPTPKTPIDAPSPAPAQAQAAAADDPRLRMLLKAGDPSDLLLLINLDVSAPNATKNIDGEIAFRASRAAVCRRTDFATDVGKSLIVERWFNARGVALAAESIPTCNDREFFANDVVVVQRNHLETLSPPLRTDINRRLDANRVEISIAESAKDRRDVEQQRAKARASSLAAINGRSPGIGYIKFDSPKTVACLLPGEAQRRWMQAIKPHSIDLHLDLGARIELRGAPEGLNDAYTASRRGECRLVAGEAADLARLVAASERDKLQFQVGSVWIHQVEPATQPSVPVQRLAPPPTPPIGSSAPAPGNTASQALTAPPAAPDQMAQQTCPATVNDLVQRLAALKGLVTKQIADVNSQSDRLEVLRARIQATPDQCQQELKQISAAALSVIGSSTLNRDSSELVHIAVCAVSLGQSLRRQRPTPLNIAGLTDQLEQVERDALKLDEQAATASERAQRRFKDFEEHQKQCR